MAYWLIAVIGFSLIFLIGFLGFLIWCLIRKKFKAFFIALAIAAAAYVILSLIFYHYYLVGEAKRKQLDALHRLIH